MNRARQKLREKIERNIQRLKVFDIGDRVRVKRKVSLGQNIEGTVTGISSQTHILNSNSTFLLYLIETDGHTGVEGYVETDLKLIKYKPERVEFT